MTDKLLYHNITSYNTFIFSYHDTANALEREAGVNLKKFEICDNIDLQTIVQV